MKQRLDMICSPDSLTGLGDTIKVFLAGSIKGAPEWQNDVPKINGVTWLSPRGNFIDYETQVEWETKALRIADIVIFWIPSPTIEVPGRSYAQTTRTEFGEIIGRYYKPILFGCYSDFPGKRYFQTKLDQYSKPGVFNSLESLLSKLRELIIAKEMPKIFFTSDTHFGSQRHLRLSKRPFRSVSDMDWTMIERWNSVVGPNDVVYHLGDFGDTWPAEYLNGRLRMVKGNYERTGRSSYPENAEILGDVYTIPGKFVIGHEPERLKEMDGYKLFGHIHGRQMVKPWLGLDVGVDCHNFTPVSEEEAIFWLNAVEGGYYDYEVWS